MVTLKINDKVHQLGVPSDMPDCGQVVNPDIVKAQIESGVVYGISAALWGEVTLKDGRVEQSNFHNYRVLRMSETPPIEVHLVRNSEAPGGSGNRAPR
jgi:isoquinoline 1-oxidoreductase beta subunit